MRLLSTIGCFASAIRLNNRQVGDVEQKSYLVEKKG